MTTFQRKLSQLPPPIVARCSCGRGYTEEQFNQLPGRKIWSDCELELADCTACERPGMTRNTISRPIAIAYPTTSSTGLHEPGLWAMTNVEK